jgi:hypothetical protein
MILLCRGKLFADPAVALRQNAFGVIATAVILIAAVEIGAPLWIAALVAGLISGARCGPISSRTFVTSEHAP